MINSGPVCSINTKDLAKKILNTTTKGQWTNRADKKDLKIFSNERIKVHGELATTLL